jgi:hypothetical protein
MKNQSKARSWIRGIAGGFLCVTAAVTFAVAGNHQSPKQLTPAPVAHSVPDEVSPLVRAAAAESGIDIGPGSDEAQLVGSPQPR